MLLAGKWAHNFVRYAHVSSCRQLLVSSAEALEGLHSRSWAAILKVVVASATAAAAVVAFTFDVVSAVDLQPLTTNMSFHLLQGVPLFV